MDEIRLPYSEASPTARRLTNQAIFKRLIVVHRDVIAAEYQPFYAELAALSRSLDAGDARGRDQRP